MLTKKVFPPGRLLLLFFVLFFMTLYSCQDGITNLPKKIVAPVLSSTFTDDEMSRFVLLDTSYVYPLETATAVALDHASRLLDAKDGVTRSISNFITIPSFYSVTGKTSIKTDFNISKPKTPGLYVINFSNNKGFIILSADKRAPKILATVGSGSLDTETRNVGLRIFLENALAKIDETVGHLESLRGDAIFNSMVAKEQALITMQQNVPVTDGRVQAGCNGVLKVPGQASPSVSCGTGTCNVYVTTTPIATANVTSYVQMPLLVTYWDQGPPFNNEQYAGGCNTPGRCGTSNSNYSAGCVPVAEGQVVAFFYAKNNVGDWRSVTNQGTGCNFTSGQAFEVSNLLWQIWDAYGIFTSQTCSNGTGAGFDLGSIHFTDPRGIAPANGLKQGHWSSWNTSDIRSSLTNGSPVIIEGSIKLCQSIIGTCPCFGCKDGHEWIIDGMRDLDIQTTYRQATAQTGTGCPSIITYITYTTTAISSTQIHQNWGWGQGTGGDPNDWYDQESFQSNIWPSQPDDINFNHANYIVPYITSN